MVWFPKALRLAPAQPGPVIITPRRLETHFGDPDRVAFRVDAPGAGAHPALQWTVLKLDGSPGSALGFIANPASATGVFLAFPVKETTLCRVRATLAGTGRFGEAVLVVHPPSRSGGKRTGIEGSWTEGWNPNPSPA
jgi:hypothetical protein